MALGNIGDQHHVGTVLVQIEPFSYLLSEDAGRERPKAFAMLDLEIHDRLHCRRTRIANDAARSQGARAKLHSSLMQTYYFPVSQEFRDYFRQLLARVFRVR